jgi:hypothetical protein
MIFAMVALMSLLQLRVMRRAQAAQTRRPGD